MSKITDNTTHLMRGQINDIEGKKTSIVETIKDKENGYTEYRIKRF